MIECENGCWLADLLPALRLRLGDIFVHTDDVYLGGRYVGVPAADSPSDCLRLSRLGSLGGSRLLQSVVRAVKVVRSWGLVDQEWSTADRILS